MFPINHVLIITKENHTFDNYFGAFPGAAGVALPHAADPHPDQGHGHDAWLAHGGAAGVTGTAKTQYRAADISAYWAFGRFSAMERRYPRNRTGIHRPALQGDHLLHQRCTPDANRRRSRFGRHFFPRIAGGRRSLRRERRISQLHL
jgi:hypothetical protein